MKLVSLLLACTLTITGLYSCAEKNPAPDATEMKADSAPPVAAPVDLSKYKQATFAAGCFWCMEGVFESVKGVAEAVSGYAGGHTINPTYEEVGSETTGHAETVNVYYDSTVIDYPTLLKVFFASQDPTQVNGQGPDHGDSYRSIAFYRNATEKKND